MRFVKIGDNYYNPQRIDYIQPNTYKHENFLPVVEVWIDGKAHAITGSDVGLDSPVCNEPWEALGIADAMVEKVVAMVNEALGGNNG
jgi:hypothetical protein